jgi:transposase-like protein
MTNYNEETKGAVMAALLAGQSVSSVAKEYDIPKGTVSGWRKRARTFVKGGRATPDPKKGERVGDLLLEYLEANLTTLKQQVIAFGDADWLRKQTASDAAVLHGVMTDKAVRLLEAFGDNDSNTDATD